MFKAPFEYRQLVHNLCGEITDTLLKEYNVNKNIYINEIVEGAVKIKAKEIYDRENTDVNLFSGILFSAKQDLLGNIRTLVKKCVEEKDGQHGPDGISECSASSDACSAS